VNGKAKENIKVGLPSEELKKLSVLLPKAVHKSLKRLAVEQDTSVTALITQMILSALEETPQGESSTHQSAAPSDHPRLEINLDHPQHPPTIHYPAA
jgi:hypothetical protein